jgi:hypothetical protein
MKSIAASIFIMSYFYFGAAFANTVQVESNIPALTLSDQFDKTCSINSHTQIIVFSHEKSVSTLSTYLSAQGAQVMQNGL